MSARWWSSRGTVGASVGSGATGRRVGRSNAVLHTEKRFQRFIALRPADFVYPEDRGPQHTIVEISMFEGRTPSAKRALISELFARIESATGIPPHSIEITITETPRPNWGVRGQNAQDLSLGYQVDV